MPAFAAMALLLAVPPVSDISASPAELPRGDQSVGQTEQASLSMAGLPLYFELNNGQADPKVRLLSRGSRSTVFLTPSEVVIALSGPSPSGEPAIFRLKFKGGNRDPQVVPEGELPGKSNYLIGDDATKWRTNIPQFSRARYKRVYSGVDVVFYGNQSKLEFDFVIAAGGDPGLIRLAFKGAEGLDIDGQGDLRVKLNNDEVVFHRPYCYQGAKEEGRQIDGRFTLVGRNCVGFKVGAYDPAVPLTIDPSLSYSTVIGGSKEVGGQNYAEDEAGNIYFAGSVSGEDAFTVDPYQASYGGGGGDAYVGKLNAAGTAVVYATYLGGSDSDGVGDIAVDRHGNAYIVGSTASSNFPLKNPLQSKYGGAGICKGDAFVAKLNSDGSALLYSTYLGGSQDEDGQGIAVDAADNAYIMGCTASSDFPTKSAFQGTMQGEGDAFLAKLNASGTALVYSTYLGGNGAETTYGFGAGAVAVDETGCAYLTGTTTSSNFPLKNAFQTTLGGGDYDAFVTKFNPSGSGLIFSTYLGGSHSDNPWAIAVAPNGNVGVAGHTYSPDFPTRNPFQAAISGTKDLFVTVLNPSGSDAVFSTYLGGTEKQEGFEASSDIAFSPSNTVGVIGRTDAEDFPVASPLQSSFQGGDADAFVSVFSANGSLAFSTYLGGNSSDGGDGVGFNDDGNLFVGGCTGSTDFPMINSVYKSGTIFIARIRMKVTGPVPHLDSISPLSATAGDPEFTLSLTGSDFVDGCKVGWDGSARPTTYVSKTKLKATIAAANLSAGGAVKVNVTNPGGGVSNSKTFNVADYALKASAESVTVTAGQTATYNLTVEPQFGAYDQAVTLSCSGMPTKCSSSFSTSSCTPGSGGATSTLTITTTAPSASSLGSFMGVSGLPPGPSWLVLAMGLFLFVWAMRAPRRKRVAAWLCVGVVVCLFGFLAACESGGGGNGSPTDPGTPKGTYTITVSGQSGSLTRSIDLTLIVN